jgi:quinol monooxygenase YgiN
MVIAAGHITVEPQQRESYLAGCVRIVELARRAAGCLDVAISADLLDPAPHRHLRAPGVAGAPRDLPQQRPS